MPNFGETLINTTTLGDQEDPNIYGLIDGGFVIAWQGNGVGDATGLFTQRYNASGAKVGGDAGQYHAGGRAESAFGGGVA